MRSAKESTCFPYRFKKICYIAVDEQGHASQINHSLSEIQSAYDRALKNEIRIFAVWPGEYRSDLFIVDDLDALADAFGVERSDDHRHVITASLSSFDDAKSQYAAVEISFGCGCKITENNFRKIVNDLREQKSWNIGTTLGWSKRENEKQTTYTLYVRRSSLEQLI